MKLSQFPLSPNRQKLIANKNILFSVNKTFSYPETGLCAFAILLLELGQLNMTGKTYLNTCKIMQKAINSTNLNEFLELI